VTKGCLCSDETVYQDMKMFRSIDFCVYFCLLQYTLILLAGSFDLYNCLPDNLYCAGGTLNPAHSLTVPPSDYKLLSLSPGHF